MNAIDPLENLNARLGVLDRRMDAWGTAKFLVVVTLAALILSVFFHAPKLWILRQPMPGSFEWDRGFTLQAQARAPWEPAAEPAMRWRLLPAWVAHLAGMRGMGVFLLPWLGLAAWLGATAKWLCDRNLSRLATASLLILLSTSGSALCVTNWWGFNDGWYLLGLSAVVLAQSRWALAGAGALCPWVDERFLMALPLAVLCRWWAMPLGTSPAWVGRAELWILGGGSAAYLVARLGASAWLQTDGTGLDFISNVVRYLTPALATAPLGWFFGWRSAWLLIIAAPFLAWRTGSGRIALLLAVVGLVTLLSQLFVAYDHSRTSAVLLPLVLAASLRASSEWSKNQASLCLFLLAVAALITPFAHVSHNKLMPVNFFPIELFRLWKAPAVVGG